MYIDFNCIFLKVWGTSIVHKNYNCNLCFFRNLQTKAMADPNLPRFHQLSHHQFPTPSQFNRPEQFSELVNAYELVSTSVQFWNIFQKSLVALIINCTPSRMITYKYTCNRGYLRKNSISCGMKFSQGRIQRICPQIFSNSPGCGYVKCKSYIVWNERIN